MTHPSFPEPQRILQIYDPVKQAQFKDMTPRARLEWLAAINRLYWLGERTRHAQRKTKRKKT